MTNDSGHWSCCGVLLYKNLDAQGQIHQCKKALGPTAYKLNLPCIALVQARAEPSSQVYHRTSWTGWAHIMLLSMHDMKERRRP